MKYDIVLTIKLYTVKKSGILNFDNYLVKIDFPIKYYIAMMLFKPLTVYIICLHKSFQSKILLKKN